MNSTKNKICRLCLKICNEDFETIQVVTEEILEILLVNMDFDVSDDRVCCKKCMEILQECFEFKSMCINTEDRLITFLESRSVNRTNMAEVYLGDKQNKNVNFSKTEEICRFCMKPVINYFVLDKVVDFKNVLQEFLPEVTLNITSNPVGCGNCLNSLKPYCTFLKLLKCVEEHIRAYREAENAVKNEKVELNNVVQHIFRNISASGADKDTIFELFFEKLFSGLILTKKCINDQRNVRKSRKKVENQTSSVTNVTRDKTTGVNMNFRELVVRLTQENFNRKEEDPKWLQCHSCNFKTKRKGRLSYHFRRFHKRGWFSCYYCRFMTQNEECLKEHQEIHASNGKFKCPKCKKTFKKIIGMHNHILKNHDNLFYLVTTKIHSCKICNYKTCDTTKLSRHTNAKHSHLEKYCCHHCSRCFLHKESLTRHISAVHLNLRPFACTDCKKAFTVKVNLDAHIVSKHKKNLDLLATVTHKIYSCDRCTYKSLSETRVSQHTKTHGVIGSRRSKTR